MSHPTPKGWASEKFALHETTTHTKKPPPTQGGTPSRKPPSRCSQPLSTNQTPHPTTKAGQQQEPPTPRTNSRKPRAGTCHQRSRPAGLLSQSPIVCPAVSRSSVSHTTSHCLLCTKPRPLQAKGSSRHQGWPTATPFFVVLLRKEVIQPHLPVRLPCYDFVPIADPTFDGSLHKG